MSHPFLGLLGPGHHSMSQSISPFLYSSVGLRLMASRFWPCSYLPPLDLTNTSSLGGGRRYAQLLRL